MTFLVHCANFSSRVSHLLGCITLHWLHCHLHQFYYLYPILLPPVSHSDVSTYLSFDHIRGNSYRSNPIIQHSNTDRIPEDKVRVNVLSYVFIIRHKFLFHIFL